MVVHMTIEQRQAHARFFAGIASRQRDAEARCQWTAPLFPLVLILEADGTLAPDARRLAERIQS